MGCFLSPQKSKIPDILTLFLTLFTFSNVAPLGYIPTTAPHSVDSILLLELFFLSDILSSLTSSIVQFRFFFLCLSPFTMFDLSPVSEQWRTVLD